MNRNKPKKCSIVREIYEDLCESLELLKNWGSEETLKASQEKTEFFLMAINLGNKLGLDLNEE